MEMNSLTQVIYKRDLAFTYRNFKNLELLSLVIENLPLAISETVVPEMAK